MSFAAALVCFFHLDETLVVAPKLDSESAAAAAAPTGPLSMIQILKSPGVPIVMVTNVFMFILCYGYTAVMPVFTYTPVSYGGLGLSPAGISLFMCMQGLSQTAWSLLVFPRLHRRFGTQRCVQLMSAWYPVVFLPIPVLNLLLRQHAPMADMGFTVLCVLYLVFSPGIAMVFTATNMAVNDVSPTPQSLATLTGMVLSLGNILRTICPATFTALYEMSIKSGILDGHLFWGLFVVFGLCYNAVSRYLPPDPK
jgi:hypothetical protein